MPDFRELLTEFDIKEAKRINDALAPKPGLIERISDAIGSEFGFGCYIGFIAGCIVTVISAALWGTIL